MPEDKFYLLLDKVFGNVYNVIYIKKYKKGKAAEDYKRFAAVYESNIKRF